MKKQKRNRNVNTSDEIRLDSFLKIIGILLIILIVFTLITMFIKREKKETPQESTIQYTKIIVGSILNRPEENYYVLVEAKDDANLSTYESLINTYNEKDDHLKVYFVDLNDAFNNTYYSEDSNLDITDISDIRFSKTTLLHIINGISFF